jgi:hypothetical protein
MGLNTDKIRQVAECLRGTMEIGEHSDWVQDVQLTPITLYFQHGKGESFEIGSRRLIKHNELYLPSDKHCGSITVSVNKSPDVIARDISRRLLPDALAEFDYLEIKRKEHEAYLAKKKEVFDAAMNIVGPVTPYDSIDAINRSGEGIYFALKCGSDGSSIDISNIPTDKLLKILTIINEGEALS